MQTRTTVCQAAAMGRRLASGAGCGWLDCDEPMPTTRYNRARAHLPTPGPGLRVGLAILPEVVNWSQLGHFPRRYKAANGTGARTHLAGRAPGAASAPCAPDASARFPAARDRFHPEGPAHRRSF